MRELREQLRGSLRVGRLPQMGRYIPISGTSLNIAEPLRATPLLRPISPLRLESLRTTDATSSLLVRTCNKAAQITPFTPMSADC